MKKTEKLLLFAEKVVPLHADYYRKGGKSPTTCVNSSFFGQADGS
ncbi:MAG: hypothetical protein Q4F52_03425 [Bacteroidaceae bacterium]|nr:hypothetical protein [Bacteroidaceae bacterium]